jgi:hypothetical protein
MSSRDSTVAAIILWSIGYYWPALVASGFLLGWRVVVPAPAVTASQQPKYLSKDFSERSSQIPMAVWALLATRYTANVHASNASVYPDQIVISMQEFFGAGMVLVGLLFVDYLGQRFCRRSGWMGGSSEASVSISTVLVILIPFLDWILATVFWWRVFVSHNPGR